MTWRREIEAIRTARQLETACKRAAATWLALWLAAIHEASHAALAWIAEVPLRSASINVEHGHATGEVRHGVAANVHDSLFIAVAGLAGEIELLGSTARGDEHPFRLDVANMREYLAAAGFHDDVFRSPDFAEAMTWALSTIRTNRNAVLMVALALHHAIRLDAEGIAFAVDRGFALED